MVCGNLMVVRDINVMCHKVSITFQSLIKLQVTPLEAEPCIPQFFVREREQEIASRRQFIIDTLTKLGHEPPKLRPLVLTEQQAVLIIQSHERARQGRLR
jgi:hypothetical protein